MKENTIYTQLLTLKKRHQCGFAVLIDPDAVTEATIKDIAHQCNIAEVAMVFLGGSLVTSNHVQELIVAFKLISTIPIVLFPGHPSQVAPNADALLFLSLISGRNAELLIGQHVIAAPLIKQSNLEVIPTGYMVIDGGKPTTVSYMSNSQPIPHNKPDIALCTAWAGELLGLKTIYMDAGSGADQPISEKMIKMVSENIDIPLIVGGGMSSIEDVEKAINAGAQIIVVGNAIEKNTQLIGEIGAFIKQYNQVNTITTL